MRPIRFVLDGAVVEVSDVEPTLTVLEWLRYRAARTGTKEGCAEGDCGACTVVVGELSDEGKCGGEGKAPRPALRATLPINGVGNSEDGSVGSGMRWRAVNACILFMPMLDGKALVTVESLGGEHPVQKAMVELHGSQCGFCTPGIVMSLYGRSIGAEGTCGADVRDVLAGNLCRCTGYGPILEAAKGGVVEARYDGEVIASLQGLADDELNIGGWTTPKTVDRLADILLERPQARIIAGATDVGLWVTKQHRQLDDIVYVGDLAELARIEETPEGVTIGAGVRYSNAHDVLARLYPDFGELVRRIGAVQVRNSGTIGGNIANGSPIGDMPPALIALGATLTLRRGAERRTMALEDFFIAYGQQDRRPGEFVESLFIPSTDNLIRIDKLSKRFDSDISAVCGAFNLRVEDGVITQARVAFGGMAGTPKRAPACEAALIGAVWSLETLDAAARALSQDYQPLSDVRGSSDYRLRAAGNLLRRLWHGGGVLDMEPVHG